MVVVMGLQTSTTGRKVGEIAAATGVTVRTLHYYEEIGLLVPSGRSRAGHRLYSDTDIARLYQISLLRRLGLPLAEIARALDDSSWNLRAVMAAHIAELDRRLDGEGRVRLDHRRRQTRPEQTAHQPAQHRARDDRAGP